MTKVSSLFILDLNWYNVGVVVVDDDVYVGSFWDFTNKNGAVPKFSCGYVSGVVMVVKILDGCFFYYTDEVIWVCGLIVTKAAVKERVHGHQ